MSTAVDAPDARLAAPVEAVGDSMTVAAWTVVSRVTGVVRGVVVAAVLGVTVFANTYQFTNSLPNLVFYGLLGGSMLSSLLIPALVAHVDSGDRRAAERVAGGFLGMIAAGAAVAVPLAALAAPGALHLAHVGGQGTTAVLLVLMLLPQIPLYGLVATAGAAMNAHGRFALAAAAPALENVGTVVVLAVVALRYPGIGNLAQAPPGALLLLGLGTTGAVAAHAAAQWYGARRAGVRLRPRAGWRDPEVRRVLSRAAPSLLQAALAAVQLLVLLVLANRVPGGVVAFQLAMNFYFLPIALGATPVALALAPRLARMTGPGGLPMFRDTFLRGLAFALFIAAPAAAGYFAIAGPISRAMAYGGFGTDTGAGLIAAAVAALSAGVAGEAAFLVATYACYARGDTRTPLRAMLLQLAVCLAIAAAAPFAEGAAVLTVLGAAMSAGAVTGAAFLVHRLLGALPPGEERLFPPLLRIAGFAVVMAAPAHAVGIFVTAHAGGLLGVFSAGVIGGAVYLGFQVWSGAPELTWVTGSLRGRLPRLVRRGRVGRAAVQVLLLAACAALGALLGREPLLAVAVLALVGLGTWIVLRPAVAAYLIIALTPLTAGIDRGTLLPVLRPNEALALCCGAALLLRYLLTVRSGAVRLLRIDRLDVALLGLAVCSSVVPLLMMLARRREITADDLQHAIVLWKYLGVYLIVRFSVRDARQAYRCLALSMAAAVVVCVVGILQSLNLFGVPRLLGTLWAPFGVERTLAIGRGSSTLALAAAVADLAVLNLALAVGLLLHGSRHRMLLAGVATVCTLGALGAGEFSTILGLVVALVTLVVVSRATRLAAYALPLLGVAAAAMWPVIETRLAGFQSASGLPESWIVRYHNLSTYFLPDLGAHGNWLLGVRPAARVPAAHEEFGWVWIESGYVWLLWGGGIPLLAAYAWFVVVTVRRGAAAARAGTGPAATVGLAVAAVVSAGVVLMIFDPHLTYRGAADALFGLLALLRVLEQPEERVDS
ncbi:lipid II flippase MurJ [Nucisporomicrobium flavum]|uniref:lipid II flippase MurJ n=1 Tax=Nucisporomicrobium flavum TaxID=2785915 RepID=UPI0018F3E7D0|nr:lipid II flippase MurJ [Nucisporomicrobium flavum]